MQEEQKGTTPQTNNYDAMVEWRGKVLHAGI